MHPWVYNRGGSKSQKKQERAGEEIIQMKKEGIRNVNPENQAMDESTRMNDGWNVDEGEGKVGDRDSWFRFCRIGNVDASGRNILATNDVAMAIL